MVEGLLGPGGVTETYLAHRTDASATEASVFAVKLLRPDRIADGMHAEARRRFVGAAIQLRDFHRPGFAKVVEVSDDAAATFMASEIVPGHDLVRLVEHHRAGRAAADGAVVSPAFVALVAIQIARLLHVAHVAKPMLCHLGLSPQNVVVGDAGDVTLLDAGIACALRGITEQPLERWAFVAPELYAVDVAAVVIDERRRVAADLYGLGAVALFLLTGEPPPPTGQPLRQDLDAIAGPLAPPLRSLLAPEPHERPESAQRLIEWLADHDGGDRRHRIADSLRAVHATVAPAGCVEGAAVRLPSSTDDKKTRRWRSLAAAFVVALVLGGAALILPTQSPSSISGATRSLPSGVRTGQSAPPLAEPPIRPALADSVLSRVAGHLVVETVPPGAMVFVDGELKGQTFADIPVGPAVHRVVVVALGHRLFRDEVDTTAGVIIRRTLTPVPLPSHGAGFINVECRSKGRLPIFLDGDETGLLCPARLIPATQGRHIVGVFAPAEHRTVLVETTVEPGAKPAVVRFIQ